MEIPPDIQAAIQTTFPNGASAEPMSGGRSGALIYSVEADGAAYVLRKLGENNRRPGTAQREQTCMQLAAQLGVAPRVVRCFPDDGIILMEKINGTPIGRGTPRETDPLGRLAATLRTLHGGPAFPAGPGPLEMFQQLESDLARMQSPPLPPALGNTLARLLPRLDQLGLPAPCHHDLNPSNILDTPDHVYLVDWEIANQGEPYLDLAQLGIWVCRDEAERLELLHKYLQQAPTQPDLQRLELARGVALSFYAAAFHLVCAMLKVPTLTHGPTLQEVFEQMAATRQPFQPDQMAHALLREAAL